MAVLFNYHSGVGLILHLAALYLPDYYIWNENDLKKKISQPLEMDNKT